jgi:hypothetical protein
VEPLSKDGRQVQVGDYQIVRKLPAAGQDLALGIKDDAAAIEHQLVLSSHQVAEGDVDDVVGRPRGEHALPRRALAGMVGRSRDVDHKLGTGQRLGIGGTGRHPDVLADVHPELQRALAGRDHQRLLTGAKIAVLVKDGVIGQVGLVVDGSDAASVKHRGGVVQVVVPMAKADDGRRAHRCPGDALETGLVGCHKAGLEEQIFRRVAGHRQLGQGHQIGAQVPGAADGAHDLALVAGQVSHGSVDLGQGDAHTVHSQSPCTIPLHNPLASPAGDRWCILPQVIAACNSGPTEL